MVPLTYTAGYGTNMGVWQGAYPPRWVVRFVKAALLLTPFYILVILIACLRHMAPLSHNGFPTKLGESLESYFERTGKCSTVLPVSANTSNTRALVAYQTCLKLNAAYEAYYRRRDAKVNPFRPDFVVTGSGICDVNTSVILLIHSLHDYYDRRKAIRETWGDAVVRNKWPGHRLRHKVKIVFVFGRHRNATWEERLARENYLYGDIIQGDFYEHYHNMTLKSLFGLKWVTTYCPSAKYLIKSDDDMIINFPLLLQVLDARNMSWAIMGPYNEGSRVYRRTSKWSIPTTVFPFYFFPPYESGSTYIIGADLVRPLYETAEYVPSIFIDDVYITGILGKILRVRHLRQEGFAYWTTKVPQACSIINDELLTGTKMKPEQQYHLWSEIRKDVRCPPSNKTIVVKSR